ncbi:MAG: SDR family oxidoreductase [Alphaproteobacteria bacterium]
MSVALIIGAGDDTGAALAKAFAREGLHVVVVRRPRHLDKLELLAKSIRDEGLKATAKACDARDEDAVGDLINDIESSIGPISVSIFNIGANVNFSIADTSPRVYRKVWEMAAYAGFLMAHFVSPHMKRRGQGTLIFTGATASLRGNPGYAAFSGAKHALRALAQSCARELGSHNIHVSHVIIDGVIDGKIVQSMAPNVDTLREQDKILNPDHIAQNYVRLHKQPRDSWTFELDLRPYSETW